MSKDDSFDRLLDRRSRAREAARPPGPCLDAETLAAVTDGSLSPADRAAAEAHAADCDRCLAVLAAIAKTSPPPSVSTRPAWISLRWLVPLTTAVVAITAWVIIQEPPIPQRPGAPQAPAATEVLKPPPPPAQQPSDATSQVRAGELQKKADAPARLQDATQRESRRSTEADKRLAAADRIDSVKSKPAPAEAPPSAPAPGAAAQNAQPLARAEMKDERARQAGASQPQPLVVSPDPASRWRIVGRRVERSTDGGRTWREQQTGTTTDLLAGSSPAANVCWIAGRSGLVLLSADGETWRRLEFPDRSADIISVTASGATTATVTTSDGRTYRTSDAGRTWTLQETAATPF